MSSGEDEEDGLSLQGLSPRPPRRLQKMFLGNLAIGRRKSTGQEFLHSRHLPSGSSTVTDPESQVRRVTRSQSNANVHGFKAQWADALVSQEPMQTSLIQLRQTVEAYENQASNENWGELWRVRADVAELDTLARAALDKQCQNMVLSHVSAMTYAHVGYITKFVWG